MTASGHQPQDQGPPAGNELPAGMPAALWSSRRLFSFTSVAAMKGLWVVRSLGDTGAKGALRPPFSPMSTSLFRANTRYSKSICLFDSIMMKKHPSLGSFISARTASLSATPSGHARPMSSAGTVGPGYTEADIRRLIDELARTGFDFDSMVGDRNTVQGEGVGCVAPWCCAVPRSPIVGQPAAHPSFTKQSLLLVMGLSPSRPWS